LRRHEAPDIYFECLHLQELNSQWIFYLNVAGSEKGHHHDDATRTWWCGPFPFNRTIALSTPLDLRVTFSASLSRDTNAYRLLKEVSLTYIPPLRSIAPKYNFTVCIAPAFGFVSHRRYVEYFELHLLLGADHFFVYEYDASTNDALLNHTWQYYQNQRNVITVTQWILPPSYEAKDVVYHLQSLALQHCLYQSSITAARYTLFFDLDEVLVPVSKDVDTWSKLVTHMKFDGDDKRCAVCFRQSYFRKDINNSATATKSPYFRDFVRSSVTNNYGKCMTRPQFVKEMDIHRVGTCGEGFTSGDFPSEDVALIHHYLSCETPSNRIHAFCNPVGQNTVLQRHEAMFNAKVDIARQELGFNETFKLIQV
jgi:hypothetical protein